MLVNNADADVGQPIGELNPVASLLFYREAADLLESAARQRGSGLVINTSSVTGKFVTHPPGQLSAYDIGEKPAAWWAAHRR